LDGAGSAVHLSGDLSFVIRFRRQRITLKAITAWRKVQANDSA
jgi:hypothetical protein